MTYKYGVPEKPLKGNPRQLSIWQHVFPVASIRRFNDNTGRVDLRHFSRSIRRFATPKDTVFCAKRAWDQRAEFGFMRSIESEYQSVVNEILDAGLLSLNHEQSFRISSFMALWQSRAFYRSQHGNFVQTSLRENEGFTKEQEEVLESRRMVFSRPDGIIPSRFMNGLAIQFNIMSILRNNLSKHKWGIIHASSGEFLVPDQPITFVIPVTPNVCLVYDNPSGYITRKDVALINRTSYSGCAEYCFARSVFSCPLS